MRTRKAAKASYNVAHPHQLENLLTACHVCLGSHECDGTKTTLSRQTTGISNVAAVTKTGESFHHSAVRLCDASLLKILRLLNALNYARQRSLRSCSSAASCHQSSYPYLTPIFRCVAASVGLPNLGCLDALTVASSRSEKYQASSDCKKNRQFRREIDERR